MSPMRKVIINTEKELFKSRRITINIMPLIEIVAILMKMTTIIR